MPQTLPPGLEPVAVFGLYAAYCQDSYREARAAWTEAALYLGASTLRAIWPSAARVHLTLPADQPHTPSYAVIADAALQVLAAGTAGMLRAAARHAQLPEAEQTVTACLAMLVSAHRNLVEVACAGAGAAGDGWSYAAHDHRPAGPLLVEFTLPQAGTAPDAMGDLSAERPAPAAITP